MMFFITVPLFSEFAQDLSDAVGKKVEYDHVSYEDFAISLRSHGVPEHMVCFTYSFQGFSSFCPEWKSELRFVERTQTETWSAEAPNSLIVISSAQVLSFQKNIWCNDVV